MLIYEAVPPRGAKRTYLAANVYVWTIAVVLFHYFSLTFGLRGNVLLTFSPSDESLLLVAAHTGNGASLQCRRHLCCSRLNCTVMDYTISISCYCSEAMSE